MAWTPRNPFSGIIDGFLRWLDRIAEDGLIRMFGRWLTAMFGRKMVSKKLLGGEEVISQALHSWIAYVYPATHTHAKVPPAIFRSPVLVTLIGIPLAIFGLPRMPVDQAWIAILIVLAVFSWAFYWALDVARDRFVITDSRVFRVWGVFSLHEAEMEIVRVLDIAVDRPWYLRLVGSGHLVLENAAQEQALREIHLIPQASERAMAIHRRRRKMLGLLGDEETGTAAQDKPLPRAEHPRKPRPVSARRHR